MPPRPIKASGAQADKPFGNNFAPDYFRPDVAAAHFGISKRQLELWSKEGKISPPYRPSPRLCLYNRAKLKAEIDQLLGHTDEQTSKEINPCDELLTR